MGAISGFAGAASKGVGAAIIGGADASSFSDAVLDTNTNTYSSKTQDAGLLKFLGN
jgi:DNA-binding ferritin-like protein (Dps family)